MKNIRFVILIAGMAALPGAARSQTNEGAPCAPISADSNIIRCWLNYTDGIPVGRRIAEGMSILQALSACTGAFPVLEAHRQMRMSMIYAYTAQYDSAKYCLYRAREIFQKHRHIAGQINAETNLGNLFVELSDWDKAASHLYKAVALADGIQADTLKILPYVDLANLFEAMNDPRQERYYYSRAYLIARAHGNMKYSAIAGVPLMMSYIEASELDSARLVADDVLQYLSSNHSMRSCSYYALAVWESARGHWDKADSYYTKMKTDPDTPEYFRHSFSFAYANFLAEKGHFAKAQPIYEDVIAKARQFGDVSGLHDVLEKYHGFLARHGAYKRAYEVAADYIVLHDSTHREHVEQQVRELNLKYETAEKEKALQKTQLALTQQANQRNWLLAGMALIGLLGAVAFFWQRNRARLAQALRDKEALLAAQKIAHFKQTQEQLAFKAMTKGEEAERSRLARELHDGLGGILSGIKLALSARKRDAAATDLHDTVGMVDKAGTELRRIAQNLMPEALARFGLVAALEDLCADTEQNTRIRTTFQHYGLDRPLPESLALPVYRMVQEALNNIVKHAQATEAMVELILENQQLHLTIEDNGIGFQSGVSPKGKGLSNIQTRVHYLGGQFDLESMAGHGATLNILIPLAETND